MTISRFAAMAALPFTIAACGVFGAWAQAPRQALRSDSSASSRIVQLSHCVISIIDDVQVPAEQPGVLVELAAQEGSRVDGDALLARVDDTDARLRRAAAFAEFQSAKAKAENDVEIRNAEATAAVADAEYADSLAVNRRSPGTISSTELRRQELTAAREHLRVDVAKMQQIIDRFTVDVRQAELDAADHEINRRRIDSPFAGEVVQVFRHRGEWVQPGDPVMRLIRMDRLRVEGFIDAEVFSQRDIMDSLVNVSIRLPSGNTHKVEGRITYVNSIIEANGEYRVWADVENQIVDGFWLLRPGKVANMDIHLGSGRPASARNIAP